MRWHRRQLDAAAGRLGIIVVVRSSSSLGGRPSSSLGVQGERSSSSLDMQGGRSSSSLAGQASMALGEHASSSLLLVGHGRGWRCSGMGGTVKGLYFF
ncbi:hypothetical protein E2562_019674 [Oryza meyeriana var. granulata]|uniref:Uncharacterized protein n=1 Tax=Oryza meyeriana var. granulata TaxID=110450 RepID=A0A6G1C6B7_9ORYZ|nr:hypothetical protein E2562_019674 [Oryza meyeriana var. granulata]